MTAYKTLSAGFALAQLGMSSFNVLSALSAVKIGVVTAAQWALNVAMTANPIGLIVVGIAALAGAAYMLIKYWEPIGDFFSSLWGSIREHTATAVDWLLEKIAFLNKPFEVVGNAFSAVSGWFGGDEDVQQNSSAAVGKLVTEQESLVLYKSMASLPEQMTPASPSMVQSQSTQISAPITIHAAAGMSPQDIAMAVQQALNEREAMALSQQRASLFDSF